jgi:signal transduction histidine kinase
MTYAPSGTGLGLYISRELARRTGGSLVLSPTGPGTTFVLERPAA